MFGHHKETPVAGAKTPSQSEVAHQFDQTNGVMKAFDGYQARMHGSGVASGLTQGRIDSTTAQGMAYGRLGSSGMV